MTNEGLRPVVASEIEVRYAIQPMGRDRELVRLLDIELMRLIELLSQKLRPESLQFNHQLLRFGSEYVLRIKIQKHAALQVFDVYLNISEVAFMVRYEGKNYSVITAKSICQIIAQLCLGTDIDNSSATSSNSTPSPSSSGSVPPQSSTTNNSLTAH